MVCEALEECVGCSDVVFGAVAQMRHVFTFVGSCWNVHGVRILAKFTA